MRLLLLPLFAALASAQTQTQVDYLSQVKNRPNVMGDNNPDYTTFYQACADAVAFNATLSVSKIWTSMATGSCAANVQFDGGRLQPGSGNTVTLGNVVCGPYQRCFDVSSGGTVAFSNMPPVVYPDWWGARPDGSDSTTAFTAASRAATGTSGFASKVVINPGDYSFASTWLMSNTNGIEVAGSGSRTRLLWTGNNSTPVIHLSGVSSSHFHDFSFYFSSAHPCLEAIELSQTPGQHTNTRNSFKKIFVDTDHAAGTLTDVVVFDGQDGNNDFHTFQDTTFYGYTESAYRIAGSQHYSEMFLNCTMGGDLDNGSQTIEKYGIKSTSVGGGSGGVGSFIVIGGFGGTSVADFRVLGYSDFGQVIQGWNSESSGRLIEVTNQLLGYIDISETRYTRTGTQTTTDFIKVQGSFLTISDSHFDTATTGTAAGVMTITYNNTGFANSIAGVSITGTTFVTTMQTPTLLFNAGGGGSDANVATYLNYAFMKWQDPVNRNLGGFYGEARNHLAAAGTAGTLVVTAGVTQDLSNGLLWVTNNGAAHTVITGVGGCSTGQILVFQVGASDSDTSISQGTGHILLTASPFVLTPSISYGFICFSGDGTAANSYIGLLQTGGR